MNHEREGDIEAEDPARMEALRRAWRPPSGFEDRTVAALKDRGLVRSEEHEMAHVTTDMPAPRSRAGFAARFALPIAASVILFGGGFMSGRILETPGGTATTPPATAPAAAPGAAPAVAQPAFMLLLWEREGVFSAPADANAEYGAWARAQAGLVIDGAELAFDAQVLSAPAGTAADGPRRDASGAHVAGYFVIRAPDEAAAARIAATCPHVKYGGTVEIRRLVNS